MNNLKEKANILFYKMLEENVEATSTEMMIEFHQQMMKEQLPKILKRVADNTTLNITYQNDLGKGKVIQTILVDKQSILSQEQEILKELNIK